MKDKAALGKDMWEVVTPVLPVTQSGFELLWGHFALTSSTGNQKTPYSVVSDLQMFVPPWGGSSSHKTPTAFTDTSVCFLGCPRQPQSSST